MDEFDEEASTLPQNARDVGVEDTAPAEIVELGRAGTEHGWAPPARSPARVARRAAIMRAITASKLTNE